MMHPPTQRRIFVTDADIRTIADADERKAALESVWQDNFAQHVLASRRLGLIGSVVGKAAVSAYTERLAHPPE